MNFGGYTPASTDITWSRRFGDCKGKTTLLLALLHGLGVEAEPALVSTTLGDGLDQRLPRLDVFSTTCSCAPGSARKSTGSTPLASATEPWTTSPPTSIGCCRFDLQEAQLEKVEPQPFDVPAYESLERLETPRRVSTRPRPPTSSTSIAATRPSSGAWPWKPWGESRRRAEPEGAMATSSTLGLTPRRYDYAYDEARHLMRLTMDGVAKMDWTHNSDVRDFDIADSSLGFNAAFKREPGPHADAPFAVNYPAYDKWTVQVILPLAKGPDFAWRGRPPSSTRSSRDGATNALPASNRVWRPQWPKSVASLRSSRPPMRRARRRPSRNSTASMS